MERLAIIGSTELANHPEVWALVQETLATAMPAELVTDGAPGVGAMAERAARNIGIPVKRFAPDVFVWDGGDKIGFKQRNEQILDYSTRLIVIVATSSTRHGPAWTLRHARKRGRPVTEVRIEA